MPRTEAQKRADKKSRKKIYCTIAAQSKRKDMLLEQIVYAAEQKGVSKNQYILGAIKSQLQKDGITPEVIGDYPLPEIIEETHPKECMCYLLVSIYAEPDKWKISSNPYAYWFDTSYVTVTPTLEAARRYAQNKFSKKAYPDHYHYIIYGRYIEEYSKLKAVQKYKRIAYEAIENEKKEMDYFSTLSEETTYHIKSFLEFMDDFKKPDYVEIINYDLDD